MASEEFLNMALSRFLRLLFFGMLAFGLTASNLFGSSWIVPLVANRTGANQTHYTSTVWILNRGTASANVSIGLIMSADDSAPAVVNQGIGAGEVLVLPNVLSTLWGISEKAGALSI